MNFKLKNLIQHFLSNIPYGYNINFLLQRYVTKKLPPSITDFEKKIHIAKIHHKNYEDYNNIDIKTNNYFEFGADWNLAIPLYFLTKGFNVYCIDIRKLVNIGLILDSLFKINSLNKSNYFSNSHLTDKNILNTLKPNFNYLAPVDAKYTSFDNNHFDFISSSVTMEHIPFEDLLDIFNECYRILKNGGIFSMEIDYKDHWSYSDNNLSIYNFLKFSKKKWRYYNPSLHFQNRLRHSDYINIIKQTKFKIVDLVVDSPSSIDKSILNSLKLDDYLKNYSYDDIAIKGSIIVLRK